MVGSLQENTGAVSWATTKPVLIRALFWQLGFCVVLAILLLIWGSWQSAYSALLAGLIAAAGSLAFAYMLRCSKSKVGAVDTLRSALRAEAVKIIVLIMLMWLAFKFSTALLAPVFIFVFVVSVLLSSLIFAASYR